MQGTCQRWNGRPQFSAKERARNGLVHFRTRCVHRAAGLRPRRTAEALSPHELWWVRIETPNLAGYTLADFAIFPALASSANEGIDSGSVTLRSGSIMPLLNASTNISIARSVFGRM